MKNPFVRFLVILSSVIVFAAAVLGIIAIADAQANYDIIPQNTYFESVDLSGMTESEAKAAIEDAVDVYANATVELTDGTDTYEFDASSSIEIDVDAMVAQAFEPLHSASLLHRIIDRVTYLATGKADENIIDLQYSVSDSAITKFVTSLATELNVEAVDATAACVDRKIVVTDAQEGRTLDTETTIQAILDTLSIENVSTTNKTVAITFSTTEPAVTAEDIGRNIVVDLSERKLYLYNGETLEKTYSICVGRPGYETPTGDFEIVKKRKNPTWYNPGSDWATSMPDTIAPGPTNPLGLRALNINVTGIRIHGTSNTASLGTAGSHGCMRMANSDVVELFELVEVGTQVFIRS